MGVGVSRAQAWARDQRWHHHNPQPITHNPSPETRFTRTYAAPPPPPPHTHTHTMVVRACCTPQARREPNYATDTPGPVYMPKIESVRASAPANKFSTSKVRQGNTPIPRLPSLPLPSHHLDSPLDNPTSIILRCPSQTLPPSPPPVPTPPRLTPFRKRDKKFRGGPSENPAPGTYNLGTTMGTGRAATLATLEKRPWEKKETWGNDSSVDIDSPGAGSVGEGGEGFDHFEGEGYYGGEQVSARPPPPPTESTIKPSPSPLSPLQSLPPSPLHPKAAYQPNATPVPPPVPSNQTDMYMFEKASDREVEEPVQVREGGWVEGRGSRAMVH